jgi:hypothetical protein
MRQVLMAVSGIVIAVVALFGLYLAFVLNWSYSDGERTGYLQKFSRKGWICKTYEGELAMTTVPGVAPVLWEFTVRNEAIVAQINKQVGQRVVLHYEEHLGLPTSCFGDTAYFVDRIQLVESGASASPPPAGK